jgi:hypothetical protein
MVFAVGMVLVTIGVAFLISALLDGNRARKGLKMTKKFTEDDIRRDDLPRDVFELIHDLAYDHEGRERFQYRKRAQAILKSRGRVGTGEDDNG